MLNESKFSKYLIYAIGEILLVVIGILIALQINNWNEDRKALVYEQTILSNLVEDLRADSASFEDNSEDLREVEIVHHGLNELILKESDGQSIENVQIIRRLLWYNPITRENDPFIASKISNEPIRREIQKYFRAMNDMEHIYNEFSAVIKGQMRPYLGNEGLYITRTWRDDPDSNLQWLDRNGLFETSKKKEFQTILFEAQLKLNETQEKLSVLQEQNEVLKEKIISRYDLSTSPN